MGIKKDSSCLIVLEGGTGELEAKKSKFIANVFPVLSEEEAVAYISQIKKQYWDARHHCTAFVVGEGQNPLMRCNDDGEPAQTAGRPMLDVLCGKGIRNILVVVTRYFGGTLLGTGGLVRAYSGAVQAGIENSVIVEKKQGVIYQIGTDYADLGKLSYLCGQNQIPVLGTDYADGVLTKVMIPIQQEQIFLKKLTESTCGRAAIEKVQDMSFALHHDELILFSETGSIRERIHTQLF